MRWTLALFLACCVLTVVLWATRGWLWLGVQPINAERAPFSDTHIHLATAVNCADGLGEWHGRVCFVPDVEASPRAQTYEPWLSFHRWGLDDETDVAVAAWIAILSFCAAFALTLRPRTAGEALLALALFATTGVQLAIERGNFDLLIAALLSLAGILLARPSPSAGIAGVLTLSLTTMLKLYTGLACALAWLAARAPWRLMLPASIAAVALAVWVVGPRELLILGQGAPEGATRFSTGARWLSIHAGLAWGVAAATTAMAIAGFAAWRLSLKPCPDFARWPRRTVVFQVAFLTAVPLFLLKDSYDYRLVLWLPCLALPFAWLRSGEVDAVWRRFASAIIALFLFVAGVELPCTWLDSVTAASGREWPQALAVGLGYGKQFAAWTLVALLILLFAAVVRHRWARRPVVSS